MRRRHGCGQDKTVKMYNTALNNNFFFCNTLTINNREKKVWLKFVEIVDTNSKYIGYFRSFIKLFW